MNTNEPTSERAAPETAALGESELSEGLERLRLAAGIILEDSYEAGSKWQVGDEELEALVRLAKEEEREACAHGMREAIKGRARYEMLRCCDRHTVADLQARNLKGENFDSMVDAMVANKTRTLFDGT